MKKPSPEPRRLTAQGVDALRPLVAQRAGEHAAGEEAFDVRVTAERDLLAYLLEAVAPALPAICGNIHLSYERHRATNAERTPTERHQVYELDGEAVRGLFVDGSKTPKKFPKDAPAGRLEGEGLWILEDGRLLELEFSGSYDEALSVDMRWTATPSVLTLQEALEDGYSANAIFEEVATALEKHERGRAIQREQARAEQLRAVLVLLKLVLPPTPEKVTGRARKG